MFISAIRSMSHAAMSLEMSHKGDFLINWLFSDIVTIATLGYLE